MEINSVHKGHRARLLETVLNAGLENMSDIQVMEFILSYVIPVKDTNPLSHRLLKQFGSVHKVLESDWKTLSMVDGLSKISAQKLVLLLNIFNFYKKDKISKKYIMGNYDSITHYFVSLLEDKQKEELYIVSLNASFEVIGQKLLCNGSIKNIGIKPTEITNFISLNNSAYIVLGHNHPGGSCLASELDKKSTEFVSNIASLLGINLLDHIIVGNDGIYSYKHGTKIRT